MRIDAHQHFWRLSAPYCSWPTESEKAIHRDFLPADLEPLLAAHGIAGTVLVQAAPDMDETLFLLDLADAHDFIRGVVGWIDMESPRARINLRRLAAHPLFKGIRPMLQSIADPLWVLDHRFDDVFELMVELGLSFDALVEPRHLEALRVLAGRHTALSIIIDHGAKPQIRDGLSARHGFAGWAPSMSLFADQPNVACKLSGLLTEARPGATLDQLRPYLDHLFEVFGSERLMWGSDWPVVELAAPYSAWASLCDAWLSGHSETDRARILGGTARRIYRIN
jgi:L-fuconolactonase